MTRVKTKLCIEMMIQSDDSYFDPNDFSSSNPKFLNTQFNGQLHAVRVYSRHIGYIRAYEHYIDYLLNLPDKDELYVHLAKLFPNIGIRTHLRGLSAAVMREYINYCKDAKDLFTHYKGYFNSDQKYINNFITEVNGILMNEGDL
jgi:hypothetical protein